MKKTIALLALLAAFPPLSTDMYLAALPLLVDSWQQPLAVVNLTLIGFYIRLIGNPRFFLLTLALSCLGVPFFAFIAVSSDIYIHQLGYSEREYGYIFACNASAFMIAPLIFSRVARRFKLTRLLPVSYLGVLIASVPMLFTLIPQPFRLALPMWFLTFFFAFGRPPGNNLILEQVEQDVGSASSLMIFMFFMTGACSMWFISLGWQDAVRILGLLGIGSATLTLAAWLTIDRLLHLKMPS